MTAIAGEAELARRLEEVTRRAERVAVINQIGRLITSSLSLDSILETTVAALANHLHYHNIAVMLVDPENPERLVLRRRGGVYAASSLGAWSQSIYEGIAGAAARSRRPLLINDVRSDPRYIPIPAGQALIAELAIPLVAEDRLLGLLNIESEREISEEDAADFETIAIQLSIAVENARLFAETRAALEQTRLLYETTRRIGEAADVNDVVRAYLEQVAARGRYACSIVLFDRDEDGAAETLVVRGAWTPGSGIVMRGERLNRSRDRFDDDLDAGRTVLIEDFRGDPRVSEDFRRQQIRRGAPPALAMIPLIVGGRRIGLVILSNAVPAPWQVADLHPYQVTAAQLAAVIENRRQQRLLAERGRRLAVLEERQRLARELHDAVTQSVFSVSLIAQSILPAVRRDPAEGERRIARLIDQSQIAMRELRAVLAELRPPEGVADEPHLPDRHDLPAALDGLLDRARDHGLDATLDAAAYVRQTPEREQALYRICQEALSNVIKHARAGRVAVTLACGPRAVRLRVADDGAGLPRGRKRADGAASPRSGGIGLSSMRERAEAVGGRFAIRSQRGGGTRVEVALPRQDGGR